jgi:putative ABC transport system substrate-binding protein
MRRREFIGLVGGAAAWPLAVRAQQTAMPVIGFFNNGSASTSSRQVEAFSSGLEEMGYVEGRNVTIEHNWLEGRYDRLPSLMAALVHRQAAVITTLGSVPAVRAAKAATATIPIVFGVPVNPVQLGLVESLARPGGNATGINFFSAEVSAKRLRLMRDLIPNATRIGLLVNPANAAIAETTTREVQEAARAIGVSIQILPASTPGEIEAAFAALKSEHADALLVGADGFFFGRAAQFDALATNIRIPVSYAQIDFVMAGGLMSYGADFADVHHQVAVYAGKILKGAKPADLPVLQSTKFQFAINLRAVRALGIEVPSGLLAIADEVIE